MKKNRSGSFGCGWQGSRDGFLKHGYQVRLGSREPRKAGWWQAGQESRVVGTFGDAARFGEIVVLP